MLRTLQPSQTQDDAEGHDEGMQRTMDVLLGGLPGGPLEQQQARELATLRIAFGRFWKSDQQDDSLPRRIGHLGQVRCT